MSAPFRVRGIPVGPGIAVGTARVYQARFTAVPQRTLPEELVEFEVERLRRAVRASLEAVTSLRDKLLEESGEHTAALLEPLVTMHEDALLFGRAAARIREEAINAEYAVSLAIEDASAVLSASQSSYFRERADDVRHVGRHWMRALRGERRAIDHDSEPHVLLCEVLSPAELALAARGSVSAVVTTTGSGTSHTALLARSMGIPAVVGARLLPLDRLEGATVVVDGLRGEVLVHPTDEQRALAEARSERFDAFSLQLRARRDLPVATTDGVEIDLRANLDFASDAAEIVRHGLGGVGLFRTEYLYLSGASLPGEDTQAEIYTQVVKALEGRPLVLRTFDLGGDKVRTDGIAALRPSESSIGRTGLRFSLLHPAELRAQMRAVLRASTAGPISLLFPRVTRIEELEAAKALFASCREELEERGVPVGEVALGTMIEVPAAALLAERFAERCDFFAIGTNDLTQFTLAVDRSDAVLADAADPLDPSVLELVGRALRAARLAGIPCCICGDVATDPVALPLLLGLGCTAFSVPRERAPFVAEAIRRSSVTDAKIGVERALELGSAREVRDLALERFAPRLGDLWEEQGIERWLSEDDRAVAAERPVE